MDTQERLKPEARIIDITAVYKDEFDLAHWASVSSECENAEASVLLVAFLDAGEREKVKSALANIGFTWDALYTYAFDRNVSAASWRDYILDELIDQHYNLQSILVPMASADYWEGLKPEYAELLEGVH